jgi:maleylacetate reductase
MRVEQRHGLHGSAQQRLPRRERGRLQCAVDASDDRVDSVRVKTPTPPTIDRRGLAGLGALLRDAGCQRVFVISGPGGRHRASVERELGALERFVFAEARRHVPSALVERAGVALAEFGADAVVSLGGGSTTGLGKALRLEHSFFFVAVPTTYAGSELTDLYGITSEGGKRTGRDPRVVPDVALYDVALTLDMPLPLSVTSLMNALAHPVSALSTGKLDPAGIERALDAAEAVYTALGLLTAQPRDLAGRRAAIDGTVLAGGVLRTSPVGEHHAVAHALGGRFDLDHAGLHSVLLPYTLARLAQTAVDRFDALARRLGEREIPKRLQGFLSTSGAPTSLASLGVTRAGLGALFAERPALPQELIEAAFAGSEP